MRRGRSPPRQRLPRHLDILMAPERLVVRHRLTPIGHGEPRVDFLGLAERLVGLLVLETVQGGHAAQKGRLRLGRSRGWKRDDAETARLRRWMRAERQEKTDKSERSRLRLHRR